MPSQCQICLIFRTVVVQFSYWANCGLDFWEIQMCWQRQLQLHVPWRNHSIYNWLDFLVIWRHLWRNFLDPHMGFLQGYPPEHSQYPVSCLWLCEMAGQFMWWCTLCCQWKSCHTAVRCNDSRQLARVWRTLWMLSAAFVSCKDGLGFCGILGMKIVAIIVVIIRPQLGPWNSTNTIATKSRHDINKHNRQEWSKKLPINMKAHKGEPEHQM